MDQSRSNDAAAMPARTTEIPIPHRKFTVEFFVGIFTSLGLACAAYLAMGLGELELFGSDTYEMQAEFDNIAGLKFGASVEIAGVAVGEVAHIELEDPTALVTLRIRRDIKIRDDDIAAIRTKGIIGDRYIKISRGSSEVTLPPGGKIIETESVVDFEDVIGKIIHSLQKDEEGEETSTTAE